MATGKARQAQAGAAPHFGRARGRVSRLAALVAVTACIFAPLASTSPWVLLERRAFDYLSTASPPPRPFGSPIIVAIDEPSLAEIGLRWPWPRALHARLLAALRAAGARAIGLDVILAEPAPDPADDVALAAVLGSDVVLAGDETVIRTPNAFQHIRTEPLAAFTATGARTGIASVAPDTDGVLRQVPSHADGLALVLAQAAGRAVDTPSRDMLMQTFGSARTYDTVSYYQALDPERLLPKNIFKDRTVLIGLSLQNAPTLDAGGADAFATSDTIHSGRLLAGAEIQATIYDNLTNGLGIEKAGGLVDLSAVLLACALAGLAVLRVTGARTVILAGVAIGVSAIGSFVLVRYAAVFVPPVSPLAAFLFVCGAQSGLDFAAERRRRREITSAFSQYLAPAVVARLANDPALLKLGGERRTLTILFCDVRGFTTISETMKDDPEQLTTLINRLLTPLSDIVLESGGTIDKYIGDCIMAFWNAPLDIPDHASRAVRAALDMLVAVEALNADLAREARRDGGPQPPLLKIGIGINTGECIVGNIGSARRFDYSVLGDSVNLASRLEGESKTYGVPLLVGERTAALGGRDFAFAELDRIAVKGRTARSAVFTVVEGIDADVLALHRAVLDRKFEGTLSDTDLDIATLQKAVPALSHYYGRLAVPQIKLT